MLAWRTVNVALLLVEGGEEGAPLELAVAGAWEVVQEVVFVGLLVGGEVLGGVGPERGFIDGAGGGEDDTGADEGLGFVEAACDDGDFGDVGVGFEGGFDFDGREAVAEGFDDVIGATVEPEVAVFVNGGAVTADKPVAARDGGVFFGSVPIVEHEAGI